MNLESLQIIVLAAQVFALVFSGMWGIRELMRLSESVSKLSKEVEKIKADGIVLRAALLSKHPELGTILHSAMASD